MSFGSIFAAINQGKEAWSIIDGIFSKRRDNNIIEKSLSDIIGHLDDIDDKITNLKVQNDKILQLLSTLPAQIRRIVKEEINRNELQRNWSLLKSREVEFLTTQDDGQFLISEGWWNAVSSSYALILTFENRAEKFLDVLKYAELINLATRGRRARWLSILLQQWLADWQASAERHEAELYTTLTAWKQKLDNKTYIASHNFSGQEDLESVSWYPQADRTRQIKESYEHCEERGIIIAGEPDTVTHCETRYKNKTIPDAAYTNARENWISTITSDRKALKGRLEHLRALYTLIARTEAYIASLPDFSETMQLK